MFVKGDLVAGWGVVRLGGEAVGGEVHGFRRDALTAERGGVGGERRFRETPTKLPPDRGSPGRLFERSEFPTRPVGWQLRREPEGRFPHEPIPARPHPVTRCPMLSNGFDLVGDALGRALRRAHGGAGDRLYLLARAFRVVDPLAVEAVGAGGDAGGCFAGVDLAGAAA